MDGITIKKLGSKELYWWLPLFFSAIVQAEVVIRYIHSKSLPSERIRIAHWYIDLGLPSTFQKNRILIYIAIIVVCWCVAGIIYVASYTGSL